MPWEEGKIKKEERRGEENTDRAEYRKQSNGRKKVKQMGRRDSREW